MIFGMPGKERPCACVLKLRLNHPPESERLGNSPERVWRTRADAASVRKPAMTTDGGAACVAPVAWRTASANERRSGAGACARNGEVAANASAITRLRLADAMEIEIDMGVEITGDVETFGHASGERFARDDGVHQGRHGELRRERHIQSPELARLDTALEDAAHQAMAARHDFLVIEAGQLGKIAGLRDHQTRDTGEWRLADQPEILAYQPLEEIARTAGEGLRERLALLDHRHDRLTDQRFEQRFLVLEVEVDRALRDAGAAGDILELGGRKPAVGKDLQRGADDLFRPGVFPSAPAGFGEGTRHLWSPKLLTERSVSKTGSRAESTPPSVVENEIGAGRRRSKLTQKRHDLAAMIGGMVDEVTKHLTERVEVFPAGGWLDEPRLIQPTLAQLSHEPAPLCLDCLPPITHLGERLQVRTLRDRGIWFLQPAMQPQLLGPHDVRQCAVNAAVAALQIPEVLLLR